MCPKQQMVSAHSAKPNPRPLAQYPGALSEFKTGFPPRPSWPTPICSTAAATHIFTRRLSPVKLIEELATHDSFGATSTSEMEHSQIFEIIVRATGSTKGYQKINNKPRWDGERGHGDSFRSDIISNTDGMMANLAQIGIIVTPPPVDSGPAARRMARHCVDICPCFCLKS